MTAALDGYLAGVKGALEGRDRALIQDALYDTRKRVDRELTRLAWEDPFLVPDQVLEKALQVLGPPEQVAEAFLQRDRMVAEALDETPGTLRPWPSLFGIFAEPKAYTSLLYMLLSLPLGIFTFTWVVTGLSVSLSLLVLVIGFPLLVLFLGSVRALGLAQGRMVEALLDVRMPRRPPVMPEGLSWSERLGGLFKDAYTWTSLLYLVLNLPLGILNFVLTLTTSLVSLGFMLLPLARMAGTWNLDVQIGRYGPSVPPPLWLAVGLGLVGFLGLVGSLHAVLGLGRLQGLLARALLVKR